MNRILNYIKKFNIIIGLLFCIHGTTFAHCNNTIPECVRLPKIQAGKDYTIYDFKMDKAYGKDPILFEKLLKQHVIDYNNISGSYIHFPSGIKAVYRSAMLAYSPNTLRELLQERGVKSIVHLSDNKTVDQKKWIADEKNIFISFNGKNKNFVHILNFNYNFKDQTALLEGQKKVATIIKTIEELEGGVLIHCLGGEHKTEIIFEIMQKCYNKVPMNNIIERIKCHTAWSPDPTKKTGYLQNNVDFIYSYPCELLRIPRL